MTVNYGFCTTTANTFVTVIPGPTAGFSSNPEVVSIIDGPVSFLDNSYGNIVGWQWMFGDGSPDASIEAPEHTYSNI